MNRIYFIQLLKSWYLKLGFLIIVLYSCKTSNKESTVKILNLSDAFSRDQEVVLSRFIDEISYVPLESRPDLMLGATSRFEVSDKFIFVRNTGFAVKPQILLFERQTGKFIREIGKQGRGPGEYQSISLIPFSHSGNMAYAISSSRELINYDIYGKGFSKIQIPQWSVDNPQSPFKTSFAMPTAIFDDNVFVSYIMNDTGSERKKMVLFNKDGIVRIFQNTQTYVKRNWNMISVSAGGSSKFYRWDNNLYFLELFSDTLYQVTMDELKPRYYFDCGKYKAQYSDQEEILNNTADDYFLINDIDENSGYIFMQLDFNKNMYTGFVEKKTNNITFCSKNGNDVSGLRDDIDGLMDVVPKDFTKENEMVYIIQPADLLKWFDQNPEKAQKAKSKFNWLNDIDEFSNPIIAIAKCKG